MAAHRHGRRSTGCTDRPDRLRVCPHAGTTTEATTVRKSGGRGARDSGDGSGGARWERIDPGVGVLDPAKVEGEEAGVGGLANSGDGAGDPV